MGLQSPWFRGDPRLEACLVDHSAHVTKGATGQFVAKIQAALATLDDLDIDITELKTAKYGDRTAAAVFSYKDKRQIINKSYQDKVDNIVGKMTIDSLDKGMRDWQNGPDGDLIGLLHDRREMVKADLIRSKQMLDVTLLRLRTVSHTAPSGGLLVTPHNLKYYDTKLKIFNLFHINTFETDDFPVSDEILQSLRRNFRGLKDLPAPSNSPIDAINFSTLLTNFAKLRPSLDARFNKEFYPQSAFKGSPLGFFAAFVDAQNPDDPTMRITPRYFDTSVVPTQDDRAVTIAHERAHTIFRANGHPGTGDNPFCVAPHLGDPNVHTADEALANPYCYEWLIDALQPNYNPAKHRGPECGT